MILATIPFPQIDPVLVKIGPVAIRWYALSYIAGIGLAWWWVLRLNRGPEAAMTRAQVDDLATWATLGVIVGGRLGYVLFYNLDFYFSNPWAAVQVWQGGMAFHGGLLGVALAMWLTARAKGIRLFAMTDTVCQAVPIGLGLGRLANFINGELYGRVTDVPWAMVFPTGGPEPRHPSQLYQATLEGLVLFVVLLLLRRRVRGKVGDGFLTGAFLVGYGIARVIGEMFRQPDAHIGFLAFGATMGMTLSVPMIALGAYLMVRFKRPQAAAA